MATFNISTVTPRGAATILETLAQVPQCPPLFLWGAYGVGKSSITRDAVAALSEQSGAQWGFIDVRASQLASVDTRGIPTIEQGKTTWALPDWLPYPERDGVYGILFLDELTLGAPSVQAAFYQLLNERELGDYRLPQGWFMVAAGNRPEDLAGVHGRQDAALMNRFSTHLNVEPDVDEWIAWAPAAGVAPEVVSFIAHRGRPVYRHSGEVYQEGLLHEYPQGGCPKGHIAVATPRSWVSASHIVKAGLPADLERAALDGCIGKAASAELVGFLRIVRTLPDAGHILRDPKGAPVPTELPTQYALTVILSNRVTDAEGFDAGRVYLERISHELAALYINATVGRDSSLKATQTYIDYKVTNGAAI
jgi:hypothetical protein